jgi:hypothetical protein
MKLVEGREVKERSKNKRIYICDLQIKRRPAKEAKYGGSNWVKQERRTVCSFQKGLNDL